MTTDTVPWPKTTDELDAYISSEVDRQHDYNTSADAMWHAALAAGRYVASRLGLTGFQASCADMAYIGASRGMEPPFGLLDGNDLLYPQSADLLERAAKWIEEWKPVLAPKARARLSEEHEHVHPHVWAHWQEAATWDGGAVPDGSLTLAEMTERWTTWWNSATADE